MTGFFLFMGISFLLANCEPAPDCTASGNKTVTVGWDLPHANQLKNVPGGGHRIYYSGDSGVSTSSTMIDVPYTTSPTSGSISGLVSGCTYYVRVQAYTALSPAGGRLSAETSIEVP